MSSGDSSETATGEQASESKERSRLPPGVFNLVHTSGVIGYIAPSLHGCGLEDVVGQSTGTGTSVVNEIVNIAVVWWHWLVV